MLKRFALLFATTTTALVISTAGAFAAPGTSGNGVLPEQLCHTAIPAHLQPATCGRGAGGPGEG